MSIQTYTYEVMSLGTSMIPLWIIDDEGNIARAQGRFKPGDPVTHARLGGRGLVINVIGHEVAVLWAEEPRLPIKKYNPLAIDEDIWIPVGTPKEKVNQFLTSHKPDPENDAWVLRQLKRMVGIK